MNARYVPDRTVALDELPTVTGLPLRGFWLALGRTAWIAVAVPLVSLFVVTIPAYYRLLITDPVPDMSSEGQTRELAAGVLQLGLSPEVHAGFILAIELALAAGFTLVSLILFVRKSNEWIGLFTSFTLLLFGLMFTRVWEVAGNTYQGLGPLFDLFGSVGFISFFILFYIFPDGRFVPRWARFAAACWVLAEASVYLPQEMMPVVEVVAGPPVLLALVVTCLVAQVYRFLRRSGPVQRQQTKWVLFGFAAAFVGFTSRALARTWVMESTPPGATWVLVDLLSGPLLVGGLLMVPVSLAFAIVRYRLWDIDSLINRALVYGTLTALVASLYVLVVMGVGALVKLEGSLLLSLVATALVAVLLQPLRTWLQRAVNRVMYGHRDEPYEVLVRLGRSLEGTLTPEQVLPRIVDTVAQALKLPYAAIALKEDDAFRLKASHGQVQAGAIGMPLIYRGETVGELRLAPRAPGEMFTPGDMRLLNDLCRQAGVAAYTVRITTDLQRSRERLVTAREEERRRIRRDLHDGLGPVLAGLTLKADTARNLLEQQPAVAAGLLSEIKAQTQAAVGDIRRLVYELRPPALDDLGLLSALHEHIAQLNEASGIAVQFDAHEPEQLPPLSAAVEVAAYRIALEALTNVVRHSGARSCTVRLKEDVGQLCVEVADDGQGLPPGFRAGVGLTSIRERAVELGGTCVIERKPEGGTRILARIPLLRE